MPRASRFFFFFFFNDTATTEIYTLSLHDALPIYLRGVAPAPGWEARYDWQGWLPYDQAPQDDGTALGYLATANQRITREGYAHFLTQDWSLPYRHRRISELIEIGRASCRERV